MWLLVKDAYLILVYNKSIWAESALLMDSEQITGVSQLRIGREEPKSYYFSKVKLIFAF